MKAAPATVKTSGEPKPYPDRLCHIDYTAHPHRCGCLSGDDEAQRRFNEYRAMTNHPTISDVLREDLELVLTYGCSTDASKEAWEKLRALLDAPMESQELASPLSDTGQTQLLAICRGAAQRCDEQHAYMAAASSDPHNWFPHKWVMDAMRSLLQVNAHSHPPLCRSPSTKQRSCTRYQTRMGFYSRRWRVKPQVAFSTQCIALSFAW